MADTLSPALPDKVERLAEEVLTAACDRKLTLAAAESCTGGLLASLLTDVPGQSHAFERGFVVYTPEAKEEMLGVPATLLGDPGPVSEIVARKMAEGALTHSKADIAVSITGFAGAGAPEDTPGLVHFASAVRSGPTLHRRCLFQEKDRAGVRLRALEVALDMFRERIG